MKSFTSVDVGEQSEISIRELIEKIVRWWKWLLSKWRLILLIGVIGGALGLIYAYLKKPIYKAELTFALEDDKTSGGLNNALGLASQFGLDLGGNGGGGAFAGDNLLMLMKSRSIIENTLLTPLKINGKEETLAEYYIYFNNLRTNWKNNPTLKAVKFMPRMSRSQFTLQQDSVLGSIYKKLIKSNLGVDKVDKKLSIITVNVSSENELFSKLFTEVLVTTVSDFYISTKTKKSVQNVNILQRQTDSVRRELNTAITGVASSVDNNPNPNPALQILRVPSQRRQVDVQANTSILSQLVGNLELAKISLRKETPLIQIIDTPILPLEKEYLGKVKGFVLGLIIGSALGILFFSIKYILKAYLVSSGL